MDIKNFVKYAAVGIGGYLIGFYEMKYKVVKAMAEIKIDELTNKEESE